MSEDTAVRDTADVLLEKLKAANAEAKQYRQERDALASRVSDYEAKEEKFKAAAKTNAVKDALKGAGIEDDRVVKLLDVDSLELGEDGQLSGFTDKLSAVKQEWPEFFDPKRRVGGKADLHTSAEPKPEISTSEAQVARLLSKT